MSTTWCSKSLVGASRLRDANDQRVALTTRATQRGRTDTATATRELQRQMQRDARTRGADRMSEGDRTAVDVDDLRVDPELPGGGDTDRRERLVDLDQIQVGGRNSFTRTGFGDRIGRLGLQRRVRSGDDAVRTDLGEPGDCLLYTSPSPRD